MASMNTAAPRSSHQVARRDQSWLLPSNRKLRNLVSISLRNLCFESRSSGRTRNKTIDDDAVPQNLKSPAKIVAQREFRALEHSRSSEDLRASASPKVKESAVVLGDDTNTTPSNATTSRPTIYRMRRRSTLEWANATPQRRQERLERVTQDRLMDVFFSLHVHGIEEPIYISETIVKTMNPTFRHVDLGTCGPGVTRLDRLVLRIWARHTKATGQWRQLLELDASLPRLQYLGKSMDQLYYSLPQNAVLFHLTDGVYTALTNFIPPPSTTGAVPSLRANSSRVLPTSSFDTLLRLSKLDDSIQDALTTRNKLAADLEALFEANKTCLKERDQVIEAEDRLKTIDYAQKTVEKQLEKATKQLAERRDSLAARRALMQTDVETRQIQTREMTESLPELPLQRDERSIKHTAIQNQRRRICEDLQKIYPLQPIPGKSLAFTIRALALPNSDDLDAENPDTVAAALGSVAHMLSLLSRYLRQPLPYPVHVRGSTSTVSDPVSLLKTNASTTLRYRDEEALRSYPLFSRGVPRFRFEYAVFLLNKDVQLLLETAFGVRVLDVRQTLPNLKYLLYVATAGEGELPARKAGGVRGLVKARRVLGGEGMERSASEDSMGSTLVGSVLSGGGGESGKGANGKVSSSKAGAVDSLRRNIGSAAQKKSDRG